MHHLLLIEQRLLEKATRRFLECKHGFAEDTVKSLPLSIFTQMRQSVPRSILGHFEAIADWIQAALDVVSSSTIPTVTIHTDFLGTHEITDLNPVLPAGNESRRLHIILSMLILAFPEVNWVFQRKYSQHEGTETAIFRAAHFCQPADSEWLALLRSGFSNLFDVTGLRNHVLASLKRYDPKLDFLSIRQRTGTAIDDEADYAVFHSYIGYRFGFRMCAVSTARLMERLLTDNGLLQPDLVIEDMFLGFTDRCEVRDPGLLEKNSNSQIRDKHFPKLKASKFRRCVTSGHERGKAQVDIEEWQADYYYELGTTGSVKQGINKKPCTGVFDLWKTTGLRDQVSGASGITPVDQQQPPNDHSIRERLPSIANRLLGRSEELMRKGPSTVQLCLYGAVLANEAGSVFGGRAPTTTLRTIALKHEFEVTAECTFFGATYNLDVESRLNDFQKSLNDVAVWFGEEHREQSKQNIYAMIVNRLLIRYREYNQFDEEHLCLRAIRDSHREMTMVNWGSFSRQTFGRLWGYALKLLSSPKYYLASTTIWAASIWLFFSLLSWDWKWSAQPDFGKGMKTLGDGLEHMFDSFLGFSMSSDWHESICPWPFLLLNCLAVLSGIFHLGIFLGHIYSFIARK